MTRCASTCSVAPPEFRCLKEAKVHLKLAKQEREVYNTQCTKCVEELKINPQSPKVVHVSFDFAQQIHFPSSPQQVGPLYFLTPRKCQLFGVCSESHMEQVNYLIDENDFTGKGANAVVLERCYSIMGRAFADLYYFAVNTEKTRKSRRQE